MQGRMQESRVVAAVAVLTGLGMAVLPTAGMASLMPLVMQRLALPMTAVAILQAAHEFGLILTALPMAALAARIGPRRGFLAAILALALLVPAAALPLDFGPLLALRVLQGAASALLLCAGWSLLRPVFGAARLGLGLGLAEAAVVPTLLLVQMSVGVLFSSIGSLGLIVPTLLMAVPSLILGLLALPEPEAGTPGPRFDGLGAVLSVLCLGLILSAVPLAVIRPMAALLVLNLGLMLSGLWVWQQWRRPAPLLPLDLLVRPGFAWPLAAALTGGGALRAADTALISGLGAPGGLSPERVGDGLVLLAVLAAGAGLLAGWSGSPRLARIGAVLVAAGLAGVAFLASDEAALPLSIAGLLAYGVGRGLFVVGNRLAVLRAVPPTRSPAAVGLLVVAGGLGTLLGSLVLVPLTTLLLPAGMLSTGLWLGLAAGAALVAALLSRSGATPAADAEPEGGRLSPTSV